ncbi:hypothetical protein SprV_0301271000 [Sparganum proliferum]
MPIGTIHQLLLVLLVATAITTTTAFSRSRKLYLDDNTPWEDRARRFRSPGLEFISPGLTARDGNEHEEQAVSDTMRDLQHANMLQKAAEAESFYASILLQKAQSAFTAASKLQNKAEDIMSMPSEELLKDHTKKEKKKQKPRGSRETDVGSESEGEGDDESGKAQERFSLFARHLHRTPFGREPTNFPRPVHARAIEISPTARELYQLGLLSRYLNGVRDNLNGIASPTVLQTDGYEEKEDNDEDEEDAEELQSPTYLAGPFRRRGIPEPDDLQEFLERFHKHAQASSDRTKRQRMTPSDQQARKLHFPVRV